MDISISYNDEELYLKNEQKNYGIIVGKILKMVINTQKEIF